MKTSGELVAVALVVVLSIVGASVCWAQPTVRVKADDALGNASSMLTAAVFTMGGVLTGVLTIAAILARRQEAQLKEFGKRLKDIQAALRDLKEQMNAIAGDTRYLSQRTDPVVRAEARQQARHEMPTCGDEMAGVLLRNLFACVDVLDASDIEYLEIAKRRFPKNREIVSLADRLISKIRGRLQGGGTGAVSG